MQYGSFVSLCVKIFNATVLTAEKFLKKIYVDELCLNQCRDQFAQRHMMTVCYLLQVFK